MITDWTNAPEHCKDPFGINCWQSVFEEILGINRIIGLKAVSLQSIWQCKDQYCKNF